MTNIPDPRQRPAEFGGLAAAVVVLIAYSAGLDDPAVIAALTVIVGAIPGVITWIVELTGGLRDRKAPS
jgi:hypothetical protein